MNWNLISLLVVMSVILLTGCNPKTLMQPSIPKVALDANAMSPKDMVEAFYGWYLGQFHTDSEVFRSPLADRIYRDSEFLSERFVLKIDTLLDGFSAIGYDPFLCAHDIPSEIKVDGIFVADDSAIVAVHTNIPDHYFGLDLDFVDARWIIDDISCSWTPEGTTKVFFSWYLSNAFDTASGKPLPIPDEQNLYIKAFLTSSFLQRVDNLREDISLYLISQFPKSSRINPGPERDSVIVTFTFEPGMPERNLLVTLIQEDGFWKIDDISLME